MQENSQPEPDRTNNFRSFFAMEMLSAEQINENWYYSNVVSHRLQEIEGKGLWTRLKTEHAELFQEILNRIREKQQEFEPDFYEWVELMRSRDFDKADKFEQEKRVNGRGTEINIVLNPLLNQAFDILVSWGADPRSLRM